MSSRNGQKGPSGAGVRRMGQAALLVAAGLSLTQASQCLRYRGRAVGHYAQRYPELWASLVSEARQAIDAEKLTDYVSEVKGPCRRVFARMVQGTLLTAMGFSKAQTERHLGVAPGTVAQDAYQHSMIWAALSKEAARIAKRAGLTADRKPLNQARLARIRTETILLAAGWSKAKVSRQLGQAKSTIDNDERDKPGQFKESLAVARKAMRMVADRSNGKAKSKVAPQLVLVRITNGLAIVAAGKTLREAAENQGLCPQVLTTYARTYPREWREACNSLGIPDPRRSSAGPSETTLRDVRSALDIVATGVPMSHACKKIGRGASFLNGFLRRHPDAWESECKRAGVPPVGRVKYDGPCAAVRSRLETAALIVASGESMQEADRRLALRSMTVQDSARRHPDIWRALLKEARDKLLIPSGARQRARTYAEDGQPLTGRGSRKRPDLAGKNRSRFRKSKGGKGGRPSKWAQCAKLMAEHPDDSPEQLRARYHQAHAGQVSPHGKLGRLPDDGSKLRIKLKQIRYDFSPRPGPARERTATRQKTSQKT